MCTFGLSLSCETPAASGRERTKARNFGPHPSTPRPSGLHHDPKMDWPKTVSAEAPLKPFPSPPPLSPLKPLKPSHKPSLQPIHFWTFVCVSWWGPKGA